MRYEYTTARRTVGAHYDLPEYAWLNSMGAGGWSLVAVLQGKTSIIYYFKRVVEA